MEPLHAGIRSHSGVLAGGSGGGTLPPFLKPPGTLAPPPTFIVPPNRGVLIAKVVTSRRVLFLLRDADGRPAMQGDLAPGVSTVRAMIPAGETWTLTLAGDEIVDLPVTGGQLLRIAAP